MKLSLAGGAIAGGADPPELCQQDRPAPAAWAALRPLADVANSFSQIPFRGERWWAAGAPSRPTRSSSPSSFYFGKGFVQRICPIGQDPFGQLTGEPQYGAGLR